MSKGIEVRLNAYNMFIAGVSGVYLHCKSLNRHATHGIDIAQYGWQAHCGGCAGEIAVAKWRNTFYEINANTFGAVGDVGVYQVRTTHHATGELWAFPQDKDDEKFILVLSHQCPLFVIRGWLYGREIKTEDNWKAKQPGRYAFYTPQETLRDMGTLCDSSH